jgi:hypothetical protein
VYIHRRKTGPIKGRCHFHLTVDALLTQDRNARTHTGIDERRSHILVLIKAQFGMQTRIRRIQQRIEFLPGTLRVVPQRLNAVTEPVWRSWARTWIDVILASDALRQHFLRDEVWTFGRAPRMREELTRMIRDRVVPDPYPYPSLDPQM